MNKAIRYNNYDFLRFLLALFVIIGHSYPLTGSEEKDFLLVITNDHIGFGRFAVLGFFSISGYLIHSSLLRTTSITLFIKKRLFRIYPALIVCILLTALVLGPIVYNGPGNYFSSTNWFAYSISNLTSWTVHLINGVFTNNPFNESINGSLWTLKYELFLYIVIGILFLVRKNNAITIIILLFLFLMSSLGDLFIDKEFGKYRFFERLITLMPYFIGGSLLAYLHKFKTKKVLLITFVLSFSLFVVSLNTDLFPYIKYILFPIMFNSFGLLSFNIISQWGKLFGDISYGMYIYGCPLQQLIYFYTPCNYLEMMIYSTVLSIFFGYISWHLIEKKALKLI